MKYVECPYCQNVNKLDSKDIGDDEQRQEHDCCVCGKTFIYTTHVELYFSSARADCLNGAPHKYKKTLTLPLVFALLRCEDCGDEKPLYLCHDCNVPLFINSVADENLICRKCLKIYLPSEAKEDT